MKIIPLLIYNCTPKRIVVSMRRVYRDKIVATLLDIFVNKAPIPIKELEPGLPGVSKFVSQFTKAGEREVQPIVRYLKEKGWIAFEAIKNDFYLVVTPRGKKHWTKLQIPPKLPKTPLPDARWLVVMFDIPNKHKTARDRFRKQLLFWGFSRLMESTFVTPYDWRKSVENLRMLLGVAPYVRLFEATNIERDRELRRTFKL